MTEYEASECLKYAEFVDRIDRELLRYQLYVSIQSNSKKEIKPTEILKLPWDNAFLDETEFKYNEKEEKNLEIKSEYFADMLNNGNLSFEKMNKVEKLSD